MEDEENLKLEWEKMGREERYRTAISGMEPRRIAEVMLLPRTDFEHRPTKVLHALGCVNTDQTALSPCRSTLRQWPLSTSRGE